MGHIFWFNAKSGTGKSTITKKIKKLLEKDFTIEVLDGDIILSKLGGNENRKKNMDAFIKKAVSMVESSSKKNQIVLAAICDGNQKQRNYIRSILGLKYHEIFLQCSEQCRAERLEKRHSRKSKILILIGKLCTVLTYVEYNPNSFHEPVSNDFIPNSFDVPSSPDFIMNSEKQTIDESVKISASYIQTIISKVCKN